MAYSQNGYPTELANKVGHIKLINDPLISEVIEAFEDCSPYDQQSSITPSGVLNFDESQITQIVTVDGGQQVVPNAARPDRQVGFIQVAAQMLRLETISKLASDPLMDPRDVSSLLMGFNHHITIALPLVGVRTKGTTVQETLQQLMHKYLLRYELYEAFSFLVFRRWLEDCDDKPFMACGTCGTKVVLPKDAIEFPCGSCGAAHYLSDYLGLIDEQPEHRSRVETVSGFRTVIEALTLFSIIIKFRANSAVLRQTLFLLDGPLLLRAQLARLVDPIREFLDFQLASGMPIFLAGVEKTGELRDFADSQSQQLAETGAYFLPGAKFISEEIHGQFFNEYTYRNRVNYGAKFIVKLGKDHLIVLNIATGAYTSTPTLTDLIGAPEICTCLSKVLSYAHANALIPIILVNSEASISNKPSSGLLAQFVDKLIVPAA